MKHSKIKKTEFSFYSFIAIGLSSVAMNLSAEGFDPVAGTDQPKISGMAFDPGAGFQMDVSAAPGVFEVETSETLEDWTPLGDVTIELGSAEFADPAATGLDRMFGRVEVDLP